MEKRRKEQFLLFSAIFCYLLLDFHVKTGAKFSLRDKRLFEISEVKITRVDCICRDTQEMLQSQSTTFLGPRRTSDEEQTMKKQIPHIKTNQTALRLEMSLFKELRWKSPFDIYRLIAPTWYMYQDHLLFITALFLFGEK